MAQLLKIEDCISRYESDVFRYTGQYIRLKKDRWNRIKESWQQKKDHADFLEHVERDKNDEEMQAKKWWRKKPVEQQSYFEEPEGDTTVPDFEDIKDQFRRELFQFQLKWASSTLREKSRVAQSTLTDPVLRFLLTELPDNILVFYKPVIQLKQAPTQLDVILVTPDSIHCLVFLDIEKDSIVTASSDRFWKVDGSRHRNQIISPIPSIQRMNYFIDSVIDTEQLNLKVHFAVVTRNGIIDDISTLPSYISKVDGRTLNDWHTKLKRQPSPIKFTQLKAAKAMLENGVVTSYNRPEWEEEQTNSFSPPTE
jgi:hypothetical protein